MKQQRDELLEYLVTGKGDSKRISQLVDELAAAEVPFKEELLGAGPWVVSASMASICSIIHGIEQCNHHQRVMHCNHPYALTSRPIQAVHHKCKASGVLLSPTPITPHPHASITL